MPANGRADEIARIERELALLRTRQANIAWGAQFFLPFCILAGALVACFLVYCVIVGNTGGIVAAVMLLMLLAVFAYFARDPRLLILLSRNWGFYPNVSYAEFLEQKIAACERRLSELKAHS